MLFRRELSDCQSHSPFIFLACWGCGQIWWWWWWWWWWCAGCSDADRNQLSLTHNISILKSKITKSNIKRKTKVKRLAAMEPALDCGIFAVMANLMSLPAWTRLTWTRLTYCCTRTVIIRLDTHSVVHLLPMLFPCVCFDWDLWSGRTYDGDGHGEDCKQR